MRRLAAALALSTALGLAIAAPPAARAGPLCTAPRDQGAPLVVIDAAGGAYAAWIDPRSGYNTDVYTQRVRPAGSLAAGWPENGHALTYVTCSKRDLSLVSDGVVSPAEGAAGLIAAWSDFRCPVGTSLDIYAHRLTAARAAAPGWPANGVAVCRAIGDQTRTGLAADGAGGAFVAWLDQRAGRPQIFAARVLASGALDSRWPVDGLLLADSAALAARPVLAPDGAGGAWIAWEDVRSDIALQHLGADGVPAPGWAAGGLVVCGAPGTQTAPLLAADGVPGAGGAHGALLAWIDRREAMSAIRATRVLADGSLAAGWLADGTPVGPAPFAQDAPVLVADGTGGGYVAWQELRGASFGVDVVAQRMAADGAAFAGWPVGGRTVSGAPADQAAPAVAIDAQGGMYVTWTDARDVTASGLDIGVQRVQPDGAIADGWPGDGFLLCSAPGDQREPRMQPDGAGGAHVAWADARNGATTGFDVAAGTVAPQGPQPTRVSDLAAVHHDGQTFLTWTSPPGSGWTYRVYRSSAPIATPADLASAALLGTVADSSAFDRRLALRTGIVRGYCVDSLALDLDPAQGLFVATVTSHDNAYYAVSAQAGAFPEDRGVTPGSTATIDPVIEAVALVRPVFQRSVLFDGVTSLVYALWAGDHDTPDTPAMANRGSVPYDFAVVAGGSAPPGPLLLRLHHARGNFMDVVRGTSEPGEWLLTLDDTLPSGWNTYWFGYHPDYDITRDVNGVPAAGPVHDYTMRRILFTLDWLLRSFPVDPDRVVVFGYSMGGIGALELMFQHPERFAAGMGVVGKMDFAFLTDPDTTSWANPGRSMRYVTDQLWGTVESNLPSAGGRPVYELLNDTHLAGTVSTRRLPVVFAVNGKLDNIVGWAEKIPFFEAMRTHRRGGTFFWDTRGHLTNGGKYWIPMEDPRYLHRFRRDRSYPALSNGSLDDDPGDGHATSGDSVGAVNAFVEWDTSIVDLPDRWEVALHTRALVRTDVVLPAPDSGLVDVTPRRTQRFYSAPGAEVHFRVVRQSDGVTVREGLAVTDSIGEVTVPGVIVHATGTRLVLESALTLDAPREAGALRLALRVERNPARGATVAHVTWPAVGRGRVDLLDLAGRRVRRLFDGDVAPGHARVTLDTRSLHAGLYFVLAEAAGSRVSRRWVVVP